MPNPSTKLIYIMDPMCSWCWAFTQPLADWRKKHLDLTCDYIVGGLAPDSDQPMSQEMQQSIARIWHQIESQTGARFNHDFWNLNTPRRSTYPACRAVISAGNHVEQGREKMSYAIQTAYYQQAKNPSDLDVLLECAIHIGLSESDFLKDMASDDVQNQLANELEAVSRLGVGGFPALLLVTENGYEPLSLGYSSAEKLETRFQRLVQTGLS